MEARVADTCSKSDEGSVKIYIGRCMPSAKTTRLSYMLEKTLVGWTHALGRVYVVREKLFTSCIQGEAREKFCESGIGKAEKGFTERLDTRRDELYVVYVAKIGVNRAKSIRNAARGLLASVSVRMVKEVGCSGRGWERGRSV